MTNPTPASQSSLRDPKVARTLDRLHKSARIDMLRIARIAPRIVPHFLGLVKIDDAKLSHSMRETFLPVSRSQGHMLYLIARSIDAQRIVEFGTSFGISTIYLAAAVKDNGGVRVTGSELDASKHARAKEHLREAGLDAFAEIELGDAVETLATVEGPIDMVLLDGWKDSYLQVLEVLKPKLRPRAIVLGDNIFRFKKSLRPYVDYMQSGKNGFVSSTLDISDGFELSVFTG